MIRHLSLSVQGALNNKRKITYFTDDNGVQISDKEARAYLRQCKAEGKKCIPISAKCDNFDYQTGCNGHEPKGLSDIT